MTGTDDDDDMINLHVNNGVSPVTDNGLCASADAVEWYFTFY